MLRNGSFSEGWTDMPPLLGDLINQQPQNWILRWLEPGESLFGAGDTAQGVPECVHKLSDQLPLNERLGGPDALILAGSATYKIFNAGAPFGAELTQIVTGLKPGTPATLTVPVFVDLHGETDPFGAESGVWVNGEGQWVNGGTMQNRCWFRHTLEFTVPDNGQIEIAIRVKSKWPRPKDFFIDGVELEAEEASGEGEIIPPPEDNEVIDRTAVSLHIPADLDVQVVTTTCHTPGIVVVSVPEGVEVKVN
ncbi:MAG: hypothetical protein CSB13_00065 [Chloroflexi bacterium]|nr:MAG: hypothetical protein CSB13_00065 [Chloroflexota bacterium]